MAHSHVKKPFKGKSFYLDLRYYRKQEDLMKNLEKLGGKIESFLSRDINYVVTDRESYKPRLDMWTPVTPKSFGFSPTSPANIYESMIGCFETRSPSSPAAEAKNTILSRGLALVQKAKQKNQGTTDVLGVCNQWNIKVIHVQKVLAFISKCKLGPLKKNDENKAPQHKVSQVYLEGKLIPPFIKVEDTMCIYKPQYKVFSRWKDVVDERLCQLIYSLQSSLQKSKALKPLKVNQSSNIMHPTSQVYRSSNIQAARKSCQSRVVANNPHHSNAATLSLRNKRQMFSKSSRAAYEKRKNVEKKRFCEICSCCFVSLEEHLESENHKRFMNEKRNFKKIENVISRLPTLQDFMQTNIKEPFREELINDDLCNSRSTLIKNNEMLTEPSVPKGALQICPNTTLSKTLGNTEKEFSFDNDTVNDTEEYVLGCSDIVLASCKSNDGETEFPFLNNSTKCFDSVAKNSSEYACSSELGCTAYAQRMCNACNKNLGEQVECSENKVIINNPRGLLCAETEVFDPVARNGINDDDVSLIQAAQTQASIGNVDTLTVKENGTEATIGSLTFPVQEMSYTFVNKSSVKVVSNRTGKGSLNTRQMFQLKFSDNYQSALTNEKIWKKSFSNITSVQPNTAKKSSGFILRKFPFTNFGFGWSTPSRKLTTDSIFPEYSNERLDNRNFISHEDYGDSSRTDSENAFFLEDLHDNVDNLCKSLESDAESDSALDLTISKSCKKISEAIVDNAATVDLPMNDTDTLIVVR